MGRASLPGRWLPLAEGSRRATCRPQADAVQRRGLEQILDWLQAASQLSAGGNVVLWLTAGGPLEG